VFSRLIFWPCFAGVIVLAIGFFAVRKELSAALGLDKLIVLGRVFYAAPLALFGAEHLVAAQFIMQVVPPWMPGRLFWTYVVGLCLLAAALSIVLMKHVRWSAALLTIMFFLFVVMIHLPIVAANPRDRFAWAVAARDLAFAAGACALALTQRHQASTNLLTVARLCIALPLIFFGIEHFLHPEFAPGVPLPKLTPAWVPFGVFWGYLAGAVLLIGGTLMLVKKHARIAAAWVGLLFTLLTMFPYLPILALATKSAELNEGQNYVADTLLFGGAVLLLAAALPKPNRQTGDTVGALPAS
jgi:uncharacterized membrane protein